MALLWSLLAALLVAFDGQESRPVRLDRNGNMVAPPRDSELVKAAKLARGWVTAKLIYDGMPEESWAPLVKGMQKGGCSRIGFGLGGVDWHFTEYGLGFYVTADGKAKHAEFHRPEP
jgi:hypothetical protein